ncbi:MAG: hypothetical protein KDA80_19625, partial [Planctomycetaceae bacterium]|nr:hypothetical protein [Planctomycetaceae bacterium]
MQMNSTTRLEIPESLRKKILEFRRRVWTIKLIEAVAGAIIGVFVGYLLTYALDRVLDTPWVVRLAIFAASVLTCMAIPLAIDRWVYRRRRLDQLARLLSQTHPSIGDQLLGIIELADNTSEQARSRALVEAAIRQVSAQAESQNFDNAVPQPKHKSRTLAAGLVVTAALLLLGLTTAAASNAWARFLAPWKNTPRYTFAAIETLPETKVVPHGEPFDLSLKLTETTEWKPDSAEVRVGRQEALQAALTDDEYKFQVPAQIEPGAVQVKVGDFSGRMNVEPMLRPELSALKATVTLPAYLQRTAPLEKEIRGGSLTVVRGSETEFTATVSRTLSSAMVDAVSVRPDGATFSTEKLPVDQERQLTLEWIDEHELSGREPYRLTITGVDDETPTLVCENLPRQSILLDSETLSFQVRARDDFGVKRVGIEWEGLDKSLENPAKGEKIIGAGNPEAEFLELSATFSGTSMEIEPQPVAVRVFVEDYFPGRERIYGPTCYYDILNAEEHAIWVTDQLSRWHRMSLDVRDREKQLHEMNKQIRELAAEQLDDPETRKQVEMQAAAERANGRRLSHLVASGEDLLKHAMRNPEIGVGHLERWAEMMQILKDIAGNRMPSVADLLKEGAKAPSVAQKANNNHAPVAGRNLANTAGGDPKKGNGETKKPTAIPTITDVESTMNPPKEGEPKDPTESKPKQPRLTLPTTMLAGNGSADNKKKTPAQDKVDEAVREQKDLLAEFEKIADELNEVLANLEGTTLVKRLKAASRKQQQVAMKLGAMATDAFGVPDRSKNMFTSSFQELGEVESASSQGVSNIMDDMAAYFDRSRFMKFKVVLDDMREQDVTAGLRHLSDDLRKENGLSISQAEYWAETLDRWAEDLVDVTKCGACPGCKAKGSLPPSIVLEVLQILEAEVNLREETRVAEQSKSAVEEEVYEKDADKLSDTQDRLRDRVDKVIVRIQEIPDAESDFARELRLLDAVSDVMHEATGILSTPDTGMAAIAAETEAIELLLQSKRFNPNGGGGGGP